MKTQHHKEVASKLLKISHRLVTGTEWKINPKLKALAEEFVKKNPKAVKDIMIALMDAATKYSAKK